MRMNDFPREKGRNEMKAKIREGPSDKMGKKDLWGGREEMAKRGVYDYLSLINISYRK